MEWIIDNTQSKDLRKDSYKSISELSDEDYDNICIICRNTDSFLRTKNSHNNYSVRKIIFYKEIHMCCVISKKSKIVKTIYPVKRRLLKKLIFC